MNDTISTWLRSLSPPLFVIVILLASYAIVLPYVALQALFPQLEVGQGPALMHSIGLVGRLLIGSLIAPVVETTLFQWAPIRLLRGKFLLPWPLVLLVSAALFALSHRYSIGYVLVAFLMGLVLAYCYAVRNGPGQRPFLLTCVVHGLRNAVASVYL